MQKTFRNKCNIICFPRQELYNALQIGEMGRQWIDLWGFGWMWVTMGRGMGEVEGEFRGWRLPLKLQYWRTKLSRHGTDVSFTPDKDKTTHHLMSYSVTYYFISCGHNLCGG